MQKSRCFLQTTIENNIDECLAEATFRLTKVFTHFGCGSEFPLESKEREKHTSLANLMIFTPVLWHYF